MTSRKINHSRKLSFQQLEDRQLMAGNVAVAVQHGSLVVTGDNKDNAISIIQTGNGQYELYASDGATTINGKSTPQTFSGVTADFNINLKGGNDVLDIDNSANGQPTITIPRNLTVNLNSGNDDFDLSHAAVLGGVSITGGSGESDVGIENSTIGNAAVNSGKNDCTISLGSGSNVVELYSTTVERDLTIKSNSSSSHEAFIGLGQVTIGRNATLQTGSGNDFVDLDSITVTGKLSIQTGSGNDIVGLGEDLNYSNGTFNGAAALDGISADQVFVDLGSGNDDLHLFGVQANQASYAGGKDNDRLFLGLGDTGTETFSGFETTIFPIKALILANPGDYIVNI